MDNPPNSLEAEQILIGYMLRWPEDLLTIDIQIDDFYYHNHQIIWRALLEFAERGQTIEAMSLVNVLEVAGKMGEIGGFDYLDELEASVPFGHDPKNSASIIRDLSRRRSILHLASEMAKSAYDLKSDVDGKTGEFINKLVSVSQKREGAVHWRKFLADLYDEIDLRSSDPKEIWGIPTGFPSFDRVTGGLQPGELMILSGKPGVGKTILAMNMATQMAAQLPGVVYSLEMPGKSITRRVVSANSQVQTRKIKSGRLEGGDWEAIIAAIEKMRDLPVFLSDSVGWTTTSLHADLARLKVTENIAWFVFDYLLLANDAREKDEIERTSVISRGLKLICRRLDLAGISIHSINKEGIKSTVPGQEDLRGSGQVAFDADLICFLTDFHSFSDDEKYLSADEKDNLRTLYFGKGRELEEPRKYLHLVKLPGFPSLGDYIPEANAQRINGKNR